MDKKLLLNNIVFGLVVVFVWLIDFHYIGRLRHKLDSHTMKILTHVRDHLQKDNDIIGIEDKCNHFDYSSQDTLYLTFVNFKTIKGDVIQKYIESYENLYHKSFDGIHKLKIYVKTSDAKVNSVVSLAEKAKQEFSGIHTQKQNIYELYFFNEFFDDKLIKNNNKVFVKVSKSKLEDDQFIENLTKQTVFYFKNLNKYVEKNRNTRQDIFQLYNAMIFKCLKQQLVYYIDSLKYVNSNRNLIFYDNYIEEIREDAFNLQTYINTRDMLSIERVLIKNDLFIYTTSYMYEDY